MKKFKSVEILKDNQIDSGPHSIFKADKLETYNEGTTKEWPSQYWLSTCDCLWECTHKKM